MTLGELIEELFRQYNKACALGIADPLDSALAEAWCSLRKDKAGDESELKEYVFWNYCNDLSEINEAIRTNDPNWLELYSADQIISITYDTNRGCYAVFWTS